MKIICGCSDTPCSNSAVAPGDDVIHVWDLGTTDLTVLGPDGITQILPPVKPAALDPRAGLSAGRALDQAAGGDTPTLGSNVSTGIVNTVQCRLKP